MWGQPVLGGSQPHAHHPGIAGWCFPPSLEGQCYGAKGMAKLPVLTSHREPKQWENGSAPDSKPALGTDPATVGRVGVPGMRIVPLCPSQGHLWASLLVPTASPGLGAGSGDTSSDSIPVCAQGPCGAPGEPGEKGQRGYAVSEGCGDTLERLSAPSGLSWDPQGPCPSWISPWLGKGES